MKKKIIFEDKHLRLEHISQGNYIHETWWGATPGELFEKYLGIIVKELQRYNADGLLLDASEHKGLGTDSQELAAKTIAEYATKHGKFKESIIVPRDFLSRFSVANYAEQVKQNSPIISKFFDDVKDAEKWMQSDEF